MRVINGSDDCRRLGSDMAGAWPPRRRTPPPPPEPLPIMIDQQSHKASGLYKCKEATRNETDTERSSQETVLQERNGTARGLRLTRSPCERFAATDTVLTGLWIGLEGRQQVARSFCLSLSIVASLVSFVAVLRYTPRRAALLGTFGVR